MCTIELSRAKRRVLCRACQNVPQEHDSEYQKLQSLIPGQSTNVFLFDMCQSHRPGHWGGRVTAS